MKVNLILAPSGRQIPKQWKINWKLIFFSIHTPYSSSYISILCWLEKRKSFPNNFVYCFLVGSLMFLPTIFYSIYEPETRNAWSWEAGVRCLLLCALSFMWRGFVYSFTMWFHVLCDLVWHYWHLRSFSLCCDFYRFPGCTIVLEGSFLLWKFLEVCLWSVLFWYRIMYYS